MSDPDSAISPVLLRLIDEVQIEKETGIPVNAYNRMHTRHNRSGFPRTDPHKQLKSLENP